MKSMCREVMHFDLFVCVEVLQSSQPISLPNHTFPCAGLVL